MKSIIPILLSLLVSLTNTVPPSGERYECGLISAGWSVPSPPSNAVLKQIIAIIRHGDRTPYNGSQCWPGDNSIWSCDFTHGEIPLYWPPTEYPNGIPRLYEKVFLPQEEVMNGNCSVGQLTSIGYSQHLANGKSLNMAYVKTGFLKSSLDPSEVYIRSDNEPRTLQSAQSITLGMFPPDEGSSKTQFVPLYTRDRMYDDIEANPVLCPKYGMYRKQFLKDKVWLDHIKITEQVLSNISKAVGFIVDEDSFYHFCDCIITHYCHNLSLPTGMTEELYREILQEITWQNYQPLKYPSVQDNARVGIGFLLRNIWSNLNASVNGERAQKFYLYSAHDTTLMQLLIALQIDNNIWPPYASVMLLELYQTAVNKPAVRLIYNGQVVTLPFCGGNEMCDYDMYSKYMTLVTPPVDYHKVCQLS